MIEITHERLEDARGFFAEVFREREFAEAGAPGEGRFVQENHAGSGRGVLRGLHFQIRPRAQGKLIRCVKGAVYDVALDLRRDSPAFGRHLAVDLTEANRKMLYLPPGFAHGYLALGEWNEVSYFTTDYYSPEHERGIRWDDPELAIPWPSRAPLVAPRDAGLPSLSEARHEL